MAFPFAGNKLLRKPSPWPVLDLPGEGNSATGSSRVTGWLAIARKRIGTSRPVGSNKRIYGRGG